MKDKANRTRKSYSSKSKITFNRPKEEWEKIVTLVPNKDLDICGCKRFKELYSEEFDVIRCSRCDSSKEKYKTMLSELEKENLPKLVEESR